MCVGGGVKDTAVEKKETGLFLFGLLHTTFCSNAIFGTVYELPASNLNTCEESSVFPVVSLSGGLTILGHIYHCSCC